MVGVVNCESTYISGGCNRISHAVDWNHKVDRILYASCNNVCVAQADSQGVIVVKDILHAHHKQVTCITWATDADKQFMPYMASGSADGECKLWKYTGDHFSLVMNHNVVSAVSHVTATVLDSGHVSLYISSSLPQIHAVVVGQKSEAVESNVINVGPGFSLCSDVIRMWDSVMLVAIASDTNLIQLYSTKDCLTHSALTELKGHSDWIRDMSLKKDGDRIMLASCSQDNCLRVWIIAPNNQHNKQHSQIRIKPKIFTVEKEVEYHVELESVLSAHEGWIYGVRWSPLPGSMQLISCSMDKCVIVWDRDPVSGVYTEMVRLGDIGGQSVGYYGVAFNVDATAIIAHSYHGGLRLWYKRGTDDWVVGVVPSGHSASVEDLCWDSNAHYLLSCSLDQTTRLHAPWIRDKQAGVNEIARPQVHGYDMRCITTVSRGVFVSGSEEKIFRVFTAPNNFRKNYAIICQKDIELSGDNLMEGASVPSLGLSNKAVNAEVVVEGGENPKDLYPVYNFRDVTFNQPPSEDVLLQNTLWPEIHKLYGHGSEVYAVAVNHTASLCASSCKASKSEHAAIIVWDCRTWEVVQRITHHSLTVTRIQFSPDDKFILSVSRDRTWALHHMKDDAWTLHSVSDKKTGHSRIIWDCVWLSDSQHFVTVSRDKRVCLWNVHNTSPKYMLTITDSVTAVHAAILHGGHVIAVGMEEGKVALLSCNATFKKLCHMEIMGDCLHHNGTVNRLQFCPVNGSWVGKTDSGNGCLLELASASADHSIRITLLHLPFSVIEE